MKEIVYVKVSHTSTSVQAMAYWLTASRHNRRMVKFCTAEITHHENNLSYLIILHTKDTVTKGLHNYVQVHLVICTLNFVIYVMNLA